MNNIITVPRIGDGSEANPYRPHTTEKDWLVVAERTTEFDIEILEIENLK